MRFMLGTHEPAWLQRTRIPLFVSHRRLVRRVRLPVARGPWALDSGAFTEIATYGHFETPSAYYAECAERYRVEVGRMLWAAPQDWMCEPAMIAKTERSVEEHQELTTESFLALRCLAPSVPWAPVLQGWRPDDYLAHVELYRSAGIDLSAAPIVGVGSVCRRQGTQEAVEIFSSLHRLGLKLHGFGLKVEGVARCWPFLESSDSMAWSFGGRKRPDQGGRHQCSNCMGCALLWRRNVLAQIGAPCQLPLAL
jgi:hypothetical protein